MTKTIILSLFISLLGLHTSAQSIEATFQKARQSIDNEDISMAYIYCSMALRQVNETTGDLVYQYKNYQIYIGVMNTIIRRIADPDMKRIFFQLEFEGYEKAIDLAFQLFEQTGESTYFENAFSWAEYNRNVLFSNTLHGLKSSHIPDSLLVQEGVFLSRIATFQDSLNLAKTQRNINQQQIDILEKHRDKWQEEYTRFLEKLQKNYPEHAPTSKKIDFSFLVQHLQQTNKALIAYFSGDKQTYAFVLTPTQQYFKRLPKIDTLIEAYHQNLHQQEKRFLAANSAIYEAIFRPLAPHLEKISTLVIIPDGTIAYIPFEALICSQPKNWDYDYKKLDYLLYHYQIAYQPSATIFIRQTKATKKIKNPSLLFFAPSFSDKTKTYYAKLETDELYQQLPHLEEVGTLKQLLYDKFDGQFFMGTQATIPNFKKSNLEHDMIHLATHTLVNDELSMDSKIVFAKTIKKNKVVEKGYLYLRDLYSLPLQADLAVLGSCETGNGIYRKGEGIRGMAYGFQFAGVPSLVYSLWKVDETATNELLNYFYANLKQGFPKDQALHQAKLKYLKQANEIAADPYYWAGFVLNGATNHYQFSSYQYYWLGGLCLLVFGGLWVLLNRFSNEIE